MLHDTNLDIKDGELLLFLALTAPENYSLKRYCRTGRLSGNGNVRRNSIDRIPAIKGRWIPFSKPFAVSAYECQN